MLPRFGIGDELSLRGTVRLVDAAGGTMTIELHGPASANRESQNPSSRQGHGLSGCVPLRSGMLHASRT